jgi:hypothetical protein
LDIEGRRNTMSTDRAESEINMESDTGCTGDDSHQVKETRTSQGGEDSEMKDYDVESFQGHRTSRDVRALLASWCSFLTQTHFQGFGYMVKFSGLQEAGIR